MNMRKEVIAGGVLAGIALLASGCGTTGTGQQCIAAQVATLSNEVSRLTQRLDAIEQNRENMESAMEPIRTYINEMRYEPVVQEELQGAP